jgi:hypothetical protein
MAKFNYKFEKYDFKRFLTDSNPERFRSEKNMFWVGSIPLPDEIVFQIFDDRGKLVGFYLNHIFALLALIEIESNNKKIKDVLSNYPDKDNPFGIDYNDIKKILLNKKSKYSSIGHTLCDMLHLDSYSIKPDIIEEALSHKGKKYNRLYLHPEVRNLLESELPWFNYASFRAQSDMFGNVLADHYKIYRGGISDALSGLFNKLIDFLILGSQHTSNLKVSSQNCNISIEINNNEGNESTTFYELRSLMDGSIWEPAYIGQNLGFYLDPEHPFSEVILNGKEKGALSLLKTLSELEFNTYTEKERKKYEGIRKELSRALKSKII